MNEVKSQSMDATGICKEYLNDCSRATFWRLRQRDDKFPKAFSLGGHPLWHRPDVQSWYDSVRGVTD